MRTRRMGLMRRTGSENDGEEKAQVKVDVVMEEELGTTEEKR